MATAEATKAAKTAKPVVEVVEEAQVDRVAPPTQIERKPRGLPGHMDALDPGGRRIILKSSECVAIAYGTLENPLILVEKVNMAMLRHCKYCLPDASSRTLPIFQPFKALNLRQVANNCQTSPESWTNSMSPRPSLMG